MYCWGIFGEFGFWLRFLLQNFRKTVKVFCLSLRRIVRIKNLPKPVQSILFSRAKMNVFELDTQRCTIALVANTFFLKNMLKFRKKK